MNLFSNLFENFSDKVLAFFSLSVSTVMLSFNSLFDVSFIEDMNVVLKTFAITVEILIALFSLFVLLAKELKTLVAISREVFKKPNSQ